MSKLRFKISMSLDGFVAGHEMEINLAPTLLGKGERLFDGIGDSLHAMEHVRTVAAPKVIHQKFAKGDSRAKIVA